MAASFGILIIAFMLFSSLALGAATAWLVVWKWKKPMLWMLTPVFAFFWLMLVGAPLVGLGLYPAFRARIAAPRPAPIAPAALPDETTTESPAVEPTLDDKGETTGDPQ